MNERQDRRTVKQLWEKNERIGDLLGLEKVATFNLTWKERRLDLPGGGECYPLIDVLEKLAEMVNMPVKSAPRRKRKAAPQKDGTNEV